MSRRSQNPCGSSVLVEGLVKHFDGRPVLEGIDLAIPPGRFLTVVGKSGCGKSTLLRILSNLETPSAGSARVLDASGADAGRNVRVVFQEPRLLPWRSVLDNVCVGIRGRDRDEKHAREVLASVGMADRLHEYPGVLSGGQRQRVAFARALVHEPCVLLLDEPFGALDALTRIEAQRLVETLWLERGFTAILVTHDVNEAVLLGDQVLLLDQGRIAARFDVDLPRPRRREHPEVARLTGAVLDGIFGSSDGAARSRRDGALGTPVSGVHTISGVTSASG